MEISGVSDSISEAGTIENPIETGRLSSVVSSADCRSPKPTAQQTGQVSEQSHSDDGGTTGTPSGESAEPPLRRRFTRDLTCAVCGATFRQTNSRSRYCSRECAASAERRVNARYRATFRFRHPENGTPQRRSRKAVENALKSGRLIRPTACESCRNATSLHAHHHLGYEREHWLDVRWLCAPCHKAAHMAVAA